MTRRLIKAQLKGVTPETRALYGMLRTEWGFSPEQARFFIHGVCVAHDPGNLELLLDSWTTPE